MRYSFFLLFLLPLTAHGFDLFDAQRGKEKVAPAQPPTSSVAAQKPVPPPQPVVPPPPPPPQVDFTLVGTSRIGSKKVAILQTKEGKQLLQPLRGARTPIEGYANYTLLEVNSREIRLEYPEDSPCRVSNAQKGIACVDNGKAAKLSLVRLNALAPPPPPVPQQPAMPPPNLPPGAVSPGPLQPVQFGPRELSPEEAAKRDAEIKKRQEIYKNFQRQEIKDEDVPPGMRVVRTPFGDRLVPLTQ
ncbi:hypothetical protein [Beggiatoa leptomitoformis]|uniref:Uncharacterized protein n=1 Tax=Beggiatoa leptomitoformis TaxID=288004 RepID=A0A2N9YE66_9GAMM|nr:hypothetical protein [Beggiatoa leptomitoformis]ALG68853.1 hypothetical protein AL038_15545 [Beggiatoa leptomitoformis]AUI68778.1 hypothetical protein BLE401_08710 [Beggiatoa leptomitoformis]